jgi:prephenate dehydratase
VSVAYRGIPGSFSYQVARKLFPDQAQSFSGRDSFLKVIEAVVEGACEYAVLPVENSLAGTVHEVYDLLLKFDLTIVGEHYHKIGHQLLALPAATKGSERVREITRVISHPMALAQCERFFAEHRWIEREAKGDTAGAAYAVACSGDTTLAAIASAEAGELYGLEVVLASVEDNPQNYTRFILVTTPARAPRTLLGDAELRCSVILSLPHRVGSLASILTELATCGANLSKIESRPIPGQVFEYYFYIDFEGQDEAITRTIASLKTLVPFLRVLGIYSDSQKSVPAKLARLLN